MVAMNTMNTYTYCLRDGYIYSNLQKLRRKFTKFYKMPAVRHSSFLLRNFSTIGIPKFTVLIIIFKFLFGCSHSKMQEKKALFIFRVLVFIFKGQDHLIMKQKTMELLRRLLIMKRHPNLRKVLGEIIMPNSTYL